MKPFISIIIPTYNRKDILKTCLERLLNQTYSSNRYEIIVVDDGSTDGTKELVMQIASAVTIPIHYVKHENQGPAKARNTGIKQSSGEILLFLDDDSFADSLLLEEIVNAFNSSAENIVAVRGQVKGLALDESEAEFICKLDEYVYNTKRGWSTNNLAYKKSVLEEVEGFDESFRQCGDIDLGARVRLKGYDHVYWEKALVLHLHESDIEMFKRKWLLGGMGLRVYFNKWLKQKPRYALFAIYYQIVRVGIRAFWGRNSLLKEQFRSTLKGFLFPDSKLKTKRV